MVVLQTKRLVLRVPESRDTDDLVETVVDPGVMRMMGTIPAPYGREHADAFIARVQALPADGPECLFAITRFDRFIGVIRVGLRDGSWFIAFWLARSHWGQGLMSEAVQAMIAHYFASREVAEIRADHFFDNLASARVLKKSGFERVCERIVHSDYRNEDVLEVQVRLCRESFHELQQ